MKSVDESVGEVFDPALLSAARDKTLAEIEDVARQIKPGMSESDAAALLKETQTARGAAKSWHPPQIRFGKNTLLPFGATSDKWVVLKNDDIFFLDIGPIFDGHEGDVGRAFAVGDDPRFQRCAEAVKQIWFAVKDKWSHEKISGEQLYEFAQKTAHAMGWVLALEKASGHRVADFPHTAGRRGSIAKWPTTLSPDRWILEIQIRHLSEPFGAFYEDLL
jgi:Xaa-Pro aminopeptidase